MPTPAHRAGCVGLPTDLPNTSLQERVELHAMAGMLVAREACVSPEVVDAVCAAPAWKTFTSHIMLGGKDSLGDDQIALAQYVAKTLVERIGEAYPETATTPRTSR